MYIAVHEHRGTSPNAVLKQKSIFETISSQSQLKIETINQWLALALIFSIPISTTLTQVLMGLILLSWLSTRQLKEKIQLAFAHPVVWVMCFLFLIFLFGMTYTVAPWREALSQLQKMSKVLYLICLIPLFRDPRLRKWGVWAFILAMMLTLILGFLKFYFYFFPTRYSGAALFKNHIDTNLMMSLAVFFTAHWLWEAPKKIKALGLILMACMTFYCLWMSDGRTGYIIFILLWMLFCLQHLSIKGILGGMSLLGIIISLTIITPSSLRPQLQQQLNYLPQEINLYHQGKEASIGQRLDYYSGSITLIQKRPLLGWGTGSFKTAYEQQNLKKHSRSVANPHSEYFNMFVQWGILGLLGFLALLFITFRMSLNLPLPERHLIQGVLAVMAIGSLANSLLMDFTSGYLFITFSALCFGATPARQRISLSPSHYPSHSAESAENPFALEGR